MRKFFKLGLVVAIVAIFFTGCRTSALYTVEAAPFANKPESVEMEKIGKSIIAAGTSLGWQMRKVKEGEILGTLFIRSHMAKIKIPYNTKEFSILYVDSSRLKYDALNNTIHSNYNGWVQNLNNAIQAYISSL